VASDRLLTNLPNDWQVEQLRITLFPSQQTPKPTDWWQGVLGTEPLTEATQRGGIVPVYQATGPLPGSEGFVNLRHEPARADWVYGPSPFDASLPYVVIGSYEKTVASFNQFANIFFRYTPPVVNRFAVGAVLLLPVTTKQEGYKFLDSLLPSVELDPDRSSDFLYRINRSRKSQVIDAKINRLSEWSVLQIMPQTLVTGSSYNQILNEPLVYLARVSIDINTVPEFADEIDPSTQLSLLGEFMDLIAEIAAKGDVI
jgi:hypothetical protein